jgi:hypothetical protein
MIIVHINPAGVENVYFQSTSNVAEDLCMAVWPVVRKELDRLDVKLRKAVRKTLATTEIEASE